ncbi:hypothetical protein SAMN05216298_0316 [Glycomyces sambucus]|uniref:Uncharacterized protein n=1 Tax=Glycomyces sambucus TaxID=380244 RepID=A0A1G9CGH6_9ACTN|nr:hypothetical protein [Glycomyces sambucus]SDK50594.1 hypothetical protein SAMN05216298_0316 [Glycomyces sambucus]
MHVEVALLYSKPVREWILMHRAQRGEIAIEGVPGPGMMLMAERTTLARYPAPARTPIQQPGQAPFCPPQQRPPAPQSGPLAP